MSEKLSSVTISSGPDCLKSFPGPTANSFCTLPEGHDGACGMRLVSDGREVFLRADAQGRVFVPIEMLKPAAVPSPGEGGKPALAERVSTPDFHALVAQVKELEEKYDRLESANDGTLATIKAVNAQRDSLRAEVERLKALVKSREEELGNTREVARWPTNALAAAEKRMGEAREIVDDNGHDRDCKVHENRGCSCGYVKLLSLLGPSAGGTEPTHIHLPGEKCPACEWPEIGAGEMDALLAKVASPPPASATEGKVCTNTSCAIAGRHLHSCLCFTQPAPSIASEGEKPAPQDDGGHIHLPGERCPVCEPAPAGADGDCLHGVSNPSERCGWCRAEGQRIAALESELAAAREEAKRLRLSLMEVRGWAEQDLKRESGRYEIGGLEQHRVDQALSGWLERVKRIEAALSVSP